MRHSSITLTMDTYGHLFPGQEADTVANSPNMIGNGPEALQMTGTTDLGKNRAQLYPQQRQHETTRNGATAKRR